MSGTANPGWSKAKYAARGVHLDEDTAGRLLEGMGDHARREMIVRIARVIRQNPAYRSFANAETTSGKTPSEVVSFARHTNIYRGTTMRSMGRSVWSLPILAVACTASVKRPDSPAPQPVPAASNPGISSPTGVWSYSYEPGATNYRVSRTAVIENQSDSVPGHEVTTNLTHESLTVERMGDTIKFAMVADTFATTTQGLSGVVQSVTLPVHVSGSLAPGGAGVVLDSTADVCNPALSALTSDLYNLATPVPAQLTQGMTWRDSVELNSCQGMIPSTATIDRTYTITGEATYNGAPVVAIERRDSVRAHGEGAQHQHRVVLDAMGNGNALMYLSSTTGRIVSVTASQDLDLSVTASGRMHHFKQSLKQEMILSR